MLVLNSASSTVILRPTVERERYTAVRVARGSVAVALNKLFHTLITKMSSTPVHVPKHVGVARTIYSTVHIIVVKAAISETDPEAVSAVHHKVWERRNTQMSFVKTSKAKEK